MRNYAKIVEICLKLFNFLPQLFSFHTNPQIHRFEDHFSFSPKDGITYQKKNLFVLYFMNERGKKYDEQWWVIKFHYILLRSAISEIIKKSISIKFKASKKSEFIFNFAQIFPHSFHEFLITQIECEENYSLIEFRSSFRSGWIRGKIEMKLFQMLWSFSETMQENLPVCENILFSLFGQLKSFIT